MVSKPGSVTRPPGTILLVCQSLPCFWGKVGLIWRTLLDAEMPVEMTRFADDARIVATRREHECDFTLVEQMDFVHRPPGRNVICLGGDGEYGCSDLRDRNRFSFNHIATFSQIIVQK